MVKINYYMPDSSDSLAMKRHLLECGILDWTNELMFRIAPEAVDPSILSRGASSYRRYTRSALLLLRDDNLSRKCPKCVNNNKLKSLAFWKLDQPDYVKQNYSGTSNNNNEIVKGLTISDSQQPQQSGPVDQSADKNNGKTTQTVDNALKDAETLEISKKHPIFSDTESYHNKHQHYSLSTVTRSESRVAENNNRCRSNYIFGNGRMQSNQDLDYSKDKNGNILSFKRLGHQFIADKADVKSVGVPNSNDSNNTINDFKNFHLNDHNYNQNSLNQNYNHHRDYYSRNDEPEWFSGGPTSKHDVIELRGFDENKDFPDTKVFNDHNLRNCRNSSNDKSHNKKEGYHYFNTNKTETHCTRKTLQNHTSKNQLDCDDVESVCTSNASSPPPARSTPTKYLLNDGNNKDDPEKEDGILKGKTNNTCEKASSDFNDDVFLSADLLNDCFKGKEKSENTVSDSSRLRSWFKSSDNSDNNGRNQQQQQTNNNSQQTLKKFLQRGNFNYSSKGTATCGSSSIFKPTINDAKYDGSAIVHPGKNNSKKEITSVEELEAQMLKSNNNGIQNLFNKNNKQQYEQHTVMTQKNSVPINSQHINSTFDQIFANIKRINTSSANLMVEKNQEFHHKKDLKAFNRLLQQLSPTSDNKTKARATNLSPDLEQQLLHLHQGDNKNAKFNNQYEMQRKNFVRQQQHPNARTNEFLQKIAEENRNNLIHVLNRPEAQKILQEIARSEISQQSLLQLANNTAGGGLYNRVVNFDERSTRGYQNLFQTQSGHNISTTPNATQQSKIFGIGQNQSRSKLTTAPLRIPSPLELQFHTQSIMQTALIRKKLEEQKEQFRRFGDYVGVSSSLRNSPTIANCGTQQINPPMFSFTPTSVLRKMTLDKDINFNQNSLDLNKPYQQDLQNILLNETNGKRRLIIDSHNQREYSQQSSGNELTAAGLQNQAVTVPPFTLNAEFKQRYKTMNWLQQAQISTLEKQQRACRTNQQLSNSRDQEKFFQPNVIDSDEKNGSQQLSAKQDGGENTEFNKWFSPELLAQASAGKLPALNVDQAINLEEFEKTVKHSSAVSLK